MEGQEDLGLDEKISRWNSTVSYGYTMSTVCKKKSICTNIKNQMIKAKHLLVSFHIAQGLPGGKHPPKDGQRTPGLGYPSRLN